MSYLKCIQISGYKYDRREWSILSLQSFNLDDTVELSFAIPTIRPFLISNPPSIFVRSAATCNAITIVVWMNNQEPSRRASNHSISVQSTSLLLYARARARAAASSRDPFFLLRIIQKERTRRETERNKKGHIGTSKDKEGVGERTQSRREGGTIRGPAIIVAFPTDKVTAPEYFLFSAADRARITRKES